MYNRDSRIMRKLLGKPASDASTGDGTAANTAAATPTSYRPIKSQNAVHAVAAPISCLDVAADGRAAVLAGPHILKTLVLDSAESPSFSFSEGIDIRASIMSQKTSGSKANVVADQLNIRDVKWHDNGTVFTACATGRIFAYNLSRLGAGGSEPVDYIQIQEDSRQVNTLDVNPHLKSWLLSGSQDGVARVFDVSAAAATRSGVLTFRQRFLPLKGTEAIRKVVWSPRVGHEMACCNDGGVILKWDVRQPQRPLLRIQAHDWPCSTIAWHPDGIHLMSAGKDSKLHVWDLGPSADKRQKPKWTITTPAPVSALAWRPGLWSATAQTRRTAQVAVSYDESSNKRYGASVVHIWDLARPTMPYKEIERFDSSPSAMLWRDQDMLWTAGQDGLFNQCDVAYAPKSIDRLSTSAVAFSPRGDVVMFLDERPQQSRPRPMMHHSEMAARSTYSPSPSAHLLSGSKSDSEEEALGTFIGPRRKFASQRMMSGRSGQHISTTPPSSFVEDGKSSLSLDESIGVTGAFKSQQVMASGNLPASTKVLVYQYLTASYLGILERTLPNRDDKVTLPQRIAVALEQFSKASENVRLYRLSQSWRVIAFAMDLLLKKRAKYHLDARSSRFQKIQVDGAKAASSVKQRDIYGTRHSGEETPRRPSAHVDNFDSRLHAVRSLLAEEIESTSNVPTPIARPVDTPSDSDWEKGHYQHGKKLTPIIEPESFDLGPSLHNYKDTAYSQGSSSALSDTSRESQLSETSTTEGYDFYDTEALTRAIDVPRPKTQEDAGSRIKPIRQDSEDSKGEMFSISDGTKKLSIQSSSVEIAGTNNRSSNSSSNLSSGRGSADTTYEPRIHGDTERRQVKVKDPPEDVFMISQTTVSTDDTRDSQTSFASQSDSDQNASFQQPTVPQVAIGERADSSSTLSAKYYNDPRPHIIEIDYLPWPDDPDFLSMKGDNSVPAALDPYLLLKRAIDFECRSSAVNAAAMVLLLGPLLPDEIIDTHLARGILRQHHQRLMSMKLFVEASFLRKLCIQGWPEGMPDWGESYTSIFGPAQQGVKAGLFCSSCRKPREVDPSGGRDAVWTCERCHFIMAPCAVCNHRDAELAAHTPGEDSSSSSDAAAADAEDADGPGGSWLSDWWWYCPGCAHGGHASCLQVWHGAMETDSPGSQPAKFSGGCCPMDGCGHACLPGKYRGEVATARSDELGRAALDSSRGGGGGGGSGSRRSSPGGGRDRSVRSDGFDIPQSKAVGMAREALNKGGSPSSGGILSSSPGRVMPAAGERERRKSVKFVKTDR